MRQRSIESSRNNLRSHSGISMNLEKGLSSKPLLCFVICRKSETCLMLEDRAGEELGKASPLFGRPGQALLEVCQNGLAFHISFRSISICPMILPHLPLQQIPGFVRGTNHGCAALTGAVGAKYPHLHC